MKCLLLTETGAPETSNASYVASCISQLQAFGIQYDRYKVQTAPAQATVSADYDFVFIPRQASNIYKSWVDSANLTIPVIVGEARGTTDADIPSSTPGVSGTVSAVADQYFSAPFSSSSWLVIQSRWWTLVSPGVALITAQPTDMLTAAAQTYAGQVTAWYTNKAGAGKLYCSSATGDTFPLLAFMLQAAYNAGDFTAAQMGTLRRAPVAVDMDHVIGTGFSTSLSVLNRWLNLIPSDGVVWCGITANADGSTPTISADVLAALAAESGKRLRFCYHEHSTGREPTTGAWPYAARGGTLADAITKANQDTYYADRKAKWEALGMSFHTPFYYVPGSNAWNEATLQLFSPETSLASDAANTTPEAGYGCTMIRNSSSNVSSRPMNPDSFSIRPHNVHAKREYMRGMSVIPSTDMALENAIVAASTWRTKFQYMCYAIHHGMSLYFHDEDFIDTQNPATAEFGVELFTQLTHLKAYLNKTTEFFADPTRYSIGRNP